MNEAKNRGSLRNRWRYSFLVAAFVLTIALASGSAMAAGGGVGESDHLPSTLESTESNNETVSTTSEIEATAVETVDSCEAITEPGTYELSTDLESNSTCITIDASDVHFDGMGHTIAEGGAEEGQYGIKVNNNRVDVTVTNVIVEGWGQAGIKYGEGGIGGDGVWGGEISNVEAVDNGQYGVYVQQGAGITVRDSTMRNTTGNDGIYIHNSRNNSVIDNTAIDNNRRGIYLGSSETYNNTVIGNEASGSIDGIRTRFDAHNNTYEDNVLESNTQRGIHLDDSPNNVLKNNTVSDTRGGNFPLGISINADGNTLIGNNVSNSENHGFDLVGAHNSTLTDNTAIDNGDPETDTEAKGFRLLRSQNTTLIENHAFGNDIEYMYESGLDSDESNTVEKLDIGSAVVSFEGKDVRVSTGEFQGDAAPGGLDPLGAYVELRDIEAQNDGYADLTVHTDLSDSVQIDTVRLSKYDDDWEAIDFTVGPGAETVSANVTTLFEAERSARTVGLFGEDTDPDSTPIEECTVIDEPGLYELENDLSSADTCLTVEVSGVTLEGNGHTIEGERAEDSVGIEVGDYDRPGGQAFDPEAVEIRNVTAKSWHSGIFYNSADRGTIADVRVENSSNAGIEVIGSDAFTIRDSYVANGSDPGGFSDLVDGIDISGDDGTIVGTIATNNTADGIEIAGDNSVIEGNEVSENDRNGIQLSGAESSFVDNVLTENDGDGISSQFAGSNNRYENNTVTGNNAGIEVSGAEENTTAVDNTLTDNFAGIVVTGGSENVTVLENVARENDNGIRFFGGQDNRGVNNTLEDNENRGIELDSWKSQAINNTVTETGDGGGSASGLYVNDIDVVVEDNTVIGTSGHGINNHNSDNNLFANNTIIDSTEKGVRLANSDNVSFVDTTVHGSGEWTFTAGEFEPSNSPSDPVENVTATNLDIGDSTQANTTLSFEASEVAIGTVENPPADPEDADSIGRYLEADTDREEAFLDVKVHYENEDAVGIEEGALELKRFDEDAFPSAEWVGVDGSSVDTTEQVVTANITEFSDFGAFAPESDEVAAVEVHSLEVGATDLSEGQETDISATVQNTGGASASVDVSLEVDDESVDTDSVVVNPGETADVEFTRTFDEAGEYDVTIDSPDADTVSTEPETVSVGAVPWELEADQDSADVNLTAVTFTLTDVPEDIDVEGYEWDFGDETQSLGTDGTEVTHVFEELLGETTVTAAPVEDGDELPPAETTIDVVDTVAPVVEVSAPGTVQVDEAFAVDASASTDNHEIANYTFETDDETIVTEEPLEEFSFTEEGVQSITVTVTDVSGNENQTTVDVDVGATPEFDVELEADAEQDLSDATVDLTITNVGGVDVSETPVDIEASWADGWTTESDTVYEDSFDLDQGESATQEIDITSLELDELTGGTRNLFLTATVDDGQPSEAVDETNTVLEFEERRASVDVPSTSARNETTEIDLEFRNTGALTAAEGEATLEFGDGDNTTVSVPELGPDETNETTIEHTYEDTGDHEVTVEIADTLNPPLANDTATTTTEELNITINLDAPADVERTDEFSVRSAIYLNAPAELETSIDLPEGLESLDDDERSSNESPVTERWEVEAKNESGDDPFEITVTADSNELSVQESVDVEVTPRTMLVRNTSAVIFEAEALEEDESQTEETVVHIPPESDTTTLDHDFGVDPQLGPEGRVVSGLDDLIEYPHGCLEQTTSPMLSALNTDQYYRGGPGQADTLDEDVAAQDFPDDFDRESVNESIDMGVERLAVGATSQNDDGSWGMWGGSNDGNTFFTSYALYSTASVENDDVHSERESVTQNLDEVDTVAAVEWLEGNQAENGKFEGGRYIDDDVPMTGFTLAALERAELDADGEAVAEDIQTDAVSYLVDTQEDDGSWDEPDANEATALAVWGLVASGDDSEEVQDAIDNGIDYLGGKQRSDGALEGGLRSGTNQNTAYLVLALEDVDDESADAMAASGSTYLIEQHSRFGWGNTQTTALAIEALIGTAAGDIGSHNVTVTFEDDGGDPIVVDGEAVERTFEVDQANPRLNFNFEDDELEGLRAAGPDVTMVAETEGDGSLVISVENEQLVHADEYEDIYGGDGQ